MLTRIFNRLLDDSFEPEIRRNISIVTLGRLVANACYRFAPPFLAIIAKDFNVSLSDIGVAVFVFLFAGLVGAAHPQSELAVQPFDRSPQPPDSRP
jgi:hypothetical protein